MQFLLQPDYQSAYRENYSCETALLHISNDILLAFEQQHMSFMALDLSTKFNTVDHDILLQTLTTKFGIMDSALQWFASYLQP